MRGFFIVNKKNPAYQYIFSLFVYLLTVSLVFSPVASYAQSVLNLPIPGAMVSVSLVFNPAILKGITVHPEDPFLFDFIIHPGDSNLEGEEFKTESIKLIKYFMAALTVPEEEMWVNLSPYEKDRIIPKGFGDTEMGRNLLAQDYMLKQLTASLMYPEEELGNEFWNRVYEKANERYGTSEIPMKTFNKVWIMPEKAVVYENGKSAFIVESHLKVMLEEDYLALEINAGRSNHGLGDISKDDLKEVNEVSSEVIKEVIIPEIEREVNQGKTFSSLRQIYNSAILAAWYKKKLQKSILTQVYINKNRTEGIDTEDKEINQKIYQRYVEAFEKGVYNFIREDYDLATQKVIPRKYFSGGADVDASKVLTASSAIGNLSNAMLGATKIRTRFGNVDRKKDVLLGRIDKNFYIEPSVEELIEEINFEIRSRYGGEVDDPEMEEILRDIFNDVAGAMRVNANDYTLHILASDATPDMMVSPGNNIWVTWAALEGMYNEYYTEIGRDGVHRRKYDRKPIVWYSSAESIPLSLSHELGHHINGDVNVLLNRIRTSRREAILGESEYRATWQDVYDSILPGGRTYRQERAADKFSIAAVEEAGYPTREILSTHLSEGNTYETDHPSQAARGWQRGILSTRLPKERASVEAVRNLDRLDSWRSMGRKIPSLKRSVYPFQYDDPWVALDRYATHYEMVRYDENYSFEIKDGLVDSFQRAVLQIVNSNPDIETFTRLWAILSNLTYGDRPLMKASGQWGEVKTSDGQVLNQGSRFTNEISENLNELVKKFDLNFSGQIDFTEENVVVPSEIEQLTPKDRSDRAEKYSMKYLIANSINNYYREEYEAGNISFTDFLHYHLALPVHARKNNVSDVLAVAKTPQDLSEGYYFIIRAAGRYWNSTVPIDPISPKKVFQNAMKAGFVIGSMYELVARGLYDGEHIRVMKEKGWLPEGATINETVQTFLNYFGREDSPLYRSAETWMVGDIAGILYLHQEYASQPDLLKEILDKEGKEFFKDKTKPYFRIPKVPFGTIFKDATDVNFNVASGHGGEMSEGYGGLSGREFLSNSFQIEDFDNPQTQIIGLIKAIVTVLGKEMPDEISTLEEQIHWLNYTLNPFHIFLKFMDRNELSKEGIAILDNLESYMPLSRWLDSPKAFYALNKDENFIKLRISILKARYPEYLKGKEILSIPTEQDLLRLGFQGVKSGESHFRSLKYSEELAKEYVLAEADSEAEEMALKKMLAELNENRLKASKGLQESHMLEHHFMGIHVVRSYRKRVKLLQAVLAEATAIDALPTFTSTGFSIPKYLVEDTHGYENQAEYYQTGMNDKDGAFHMPYTDYENHYAAALGRLYEVVLTVEDAEHMLRTFDFSKAPFLKYKLEILRLYYLSRDPIREAKSLNEALDVMDEYLSSENPYRWVLFDEIWAQFGYGLGDHPVERVLTALPNLNYFNRSSDKKKLAKINGEFLKNFFDNLGPRDLEKEIDDRYSYTFIDSFVKSVQTIEREIYEAVVANNRLSDDLGEKLRQVEKIFQTSSDSGASHPVLDRVRWDYMRTLDIDSGEYKELQDELRDPEVKTKAAIPLLERELGASAELIHEQQRDLIRKHLPVGEERDRYLDEHLKKAQGLTPVEIERYNHVFSAQPKSEIRKSQAVVQFELDRIRKLEPEDKLELVGFFLSHGNRQFIQNKKSRDQELFWDVANYLFGRDSDEQVAFFHNLFMGEESVLYEQNVEAELVNLVLLAGEKFMPRNRKSLLTALFESLYDSLDFWDRGQLLSELIVDSQMPQRNGQFVPPEHSPERAVKILRLIKGFGPKGAQILRSHKGILGESPEAQRYRDAFEEFEEKAQRVDLVDAIKVIERSFGGSFYLYFQSIDGVLGAGSVKKVSLATLKDGRKVAIKYIDLDYARRIQQSLEILRKTIGNMENWRDQFPDLPLLGTILTAVEQDIEKEQDLLSEHRIYSELRARGQVRAEIFERNNVLYPMTHEELGLPITDGHVVVEGVFEVISLDDVNALQERNISREEAIKMHIREQLEQLLIDGVFDYDARPANWTTIALPRGEIKLGYFDKAQSLLLSSGEFQGLKDMLFAMRMGRLGVNGFETGLRQFEESLAPVKLPTFDLVKSVVQKALQRKDTNPYLVMQDIVTQLEQEGVPMSSSNSLKLSMWLRQLDRYVQMVPDFNMQAEIIGIVMKKGRRGSDPLGEGQSSSPADNSMLREKGGIDLNLNSINLQIQGEGVNFDLINIQEYFPIEPVRGFTPIIINVTPITNVPLLLGDKKTEDGQRLSRPQ